MSDLSERFSMIYTSSVTSRAHSVSTPLINSRQYGFGSSQTLNRTTSRKMPDIPINFSPTNKPATTREVPRPKNKDARRSLQPTFQFVEQSILEEVEENPTSKPKETPIKATAAKEPSITATTAKEPPITATVADIKPITTAEIKKTDSFNEQLYHLMGEIYELANTPNVLTLGQLHQHLSSTKKYSALSCFLHSQMSLFGVLKSLFNYSFYFEKNADDVLIVPIKSIPSGCSLSDNVQPNYYKKGTTLTCRLFRFEKKANENSCIPINFKMEFLVQNETKEMELIEILSQYNKILSDVNDKPIIAYLGRLVFYRTSENSLKRCRVVSVNGADITLECIDSGRRIHYANPNALFQLPPNFTLKRYPPQHIVTSFESFEEFKNAEILKRMCFELNELMRQTTQASVEILGSYMDDSNYSENYIVNVTVLSSNGDRLDFPTTVFY